MGFLEMMSTVATIKKMHQIQSQHIRQCKKKKSVNVKPQEQKQSQMKHTEKTQEKKTDSVICESIASDLTHI